MKRVFKFKKGQFWDGDEDIIYAIFDILCGDTNIVQKDTKITIISETTLKSSSMKKEKNPAHYCQNGCGKYLGFRGFCSTKCHNEFYDGLVKNI